MPYLALGKQVLDGNSHLADARDPAAADLIVLALKAWRGDDEADEECPVMPELRNPRHAVRQEGDEYACACGARWDVHDGIDHP